MTMKKFMFIGLLLLGCVAPKDLAAPDTPDYLTARFISENRVQYAVDLNQPFTVDIYCTVNDRLTFIGSVYSESPCEKEVSASFNGNPPENYIFLLLSDNIIERDTIK